MNSNGRKAAKSFLPPGVVLARAAYRQIDLIGWSRPRPLPPTPVQRVLERVTITQAVIVADVPRTPEKKSADRPPHVSQQGAPRRDLRLLDLDWCDIRCYQSHVSDKAGLRRHREARHA
jgi:hypothetical protein